MKPKYWDVSDTTKNYNANILTISPVNGLEFKLNRYYLLTSQDLTLNGFNQTLVGLCYNTSSNSVSFYTSQLTDYSWIKYIFELPQSFADGLTTFNIDITKYKDTSLIPLDFNQCRNLFSSLTVGNTLQLYSVLSAPKVLQRITLTPAQGNNYLFDSNTTNLINLLVIKLSPPVSGVINLQNYDGTTFTTFATIQTNDIFDTYVVDVQGRVQRLDVNNCLRLDFSGLPFYMMEIEVIGGIIEGYFEGGIIEG